MPPAIDLMPLVLATGLVALLLRFAFLNHRMAERNPTRVLAQMGWIVAAAGVSALVLASVLIRRSAL